MAPRGKAGFYDALDPTGKPGQFVGLEVKSGGADLTRTQRIFDSTVPPLVGAPEPMGPMSVYPPGHMAGDPDLPVMGDGVPDEYP